MRSFTVMGTPCRGGSSPGGAVMTVRSAARAACRASSVRTVTKALMVGFTAASLFRTASVASTGEIFRSRISRASSVALSQVSSSGIAVLRRGHRFLSGWARGRGRPQHAPVGDETRLCPSVDLYRAVDQEEVAVAARLNRAHGAPHPHAVAGPDRAHESHPVEPVVPAEPRSVVDIQHGIHQMIEKPQQVEALNKSVGVTGGIELDLVVVQIGRVF